MATTRQPLFDLFESQGFGAQSKYEEAARNSEILAALPSSGQRKQIFAEFLNYAKGKAKEEKRKRQQEARVAYKEALRSWLPKVFDTVTFPSVARQFHSAPFWSALAEEELDETFQEEMESLDRTLTQAEKDTAMWMRVDELKKMFDERCSWESSGFARDVLPMVQAERPDAKPIEVLVAWKEFVADCESKELERKRRQIYRRERKARQGFLSILRSFGDRLGAMRWSEVHESVRDTEAYIELIGSHGSQPFDLFNEVQGDLPIDVIQVGGMD